MDGRAIVCMQPGRTAIDTRRPLADAVEAYLQVLRDEGRSSHTVASTRLDLLQLSRFLSRQPLREVQLRDLRRFMGWLTRQQQNKTSSLRRKTSTLKGFFRHLHASDALSEDPSTRLIYPVLERVDGRPLSAAECDALVEAAHTDLWLALTLTFLDAGLKRDEAVALRAEDVDLHPVEGTPRLAIRHRQESQRARRRVLGLSDRLADALGRILTARPEDDDETIFGLSPRGVDFVVETCGKRAGVRSGQKVTPQMLRDAYACARLRSLATIEQALHARPSALREARREHDRILLRELGLSDTSVAVDRYRRLLAAGEQDRPEEPRLIDQ
ncbi:MAG: site-specific integrase [Chloroflexi bacterium]|nr:site-specific integrase [Chloroflexota bacterium]